MREPHQSLANSLLTAGLTVTTIPLVLGGLVAAGESRDGSVLICGAASLLALAIVGLRRPTSTASTLEDMAEAGSADVVTDQP